MLEAPIYFAGCDISAKGHIRPAAYLREMQKIACLDLANYALSPELLAEQGIAFVLSKTSLRVLRDRLPSAALTLLTYPRAGKGVSFLRDFVFSQDGQTVATATTRWGIIDLNSRALVRPSQLPSPIVGEERSVGYDCPRLSPAIPETAESLGTHPVLRCMTDANGHFNNAAYLDLCLDLTPDEPFCAMDIEYRHELLEGDTVRLLAQTDADGARLLYGTREAENEACFCVRLSDKPL